MGNVSDLVCCTTKPNGLRQNRWTGGETVLPGAGGAFALALEADSGVTCCSTEMPRIPDNCTFSAPSGGRWPTPPGRRDVRAYWHGARQPPRSLSRLDLPPQLADSFAHPAVFRSFPWSSRSLDVFG